MKSPCDRTFVFFEVVFILAGLKQLHRYNRYIDRPTDKWSGNSASGNTHTGLLLLIHVWPRARHFSGYCCWFDVGPRARHLSAYCRFMWHTEQHTLLGIVVGIWGPRATHLTLTWYCRFMWHLGQHTLLGIVVGLCGGLGRALGDQLGSHSSGQEQTLYIINTKKCQAS
jgi:hypothetical protein